jgi:hypothetical protein
MSGYVRSATTLAAMTVTVNTRKAPCRRG